MLTFRVSRRSCRTAALALAIYGATCFALAASVSQGVRFNTPGVLDLAAHGTLLHGETLQLQVLDAGAAKAIFSAPTLDQEHATLPFSDSAFGCPAESKTCIAQHERQLITAQPAAVKRDGKRLIVKPASAVPAMFVDWIQATTKNADGDSETHWYLGTLPGNGLHQVEVQFGHDAPGSFLVNSKSGKTAFVHNGSDIVGLSPDGLHLITFNPDNPPQTLRVAALDASGPRLQLECTVDDEHATVQLKGWRDAHNIDLVIDGAPLRLTRADQGWAVAAAPQTSANSLLQCRGP